MTSESFPISRFFGAQGAFLRALLLLVAAGTAERLVAQPGGDSIPLPEHPRPDFERSSWLNLNGSWSLRFDGRSAGEDERWFEGRVPFPETVTVPFPWGSELSGVEDMGYVAWYARRITVPETWDGKRVFLVVGACDWQTKAWLDGQSLGSHRGGYTPFEFDLTPCAMPGREQLLVLRVDDSPHPFKLEGKQGYGPARGIWQTVYLEARPSLHLEAIHFTPDIRASRVRVKVYLSGPAPTSARLRLEFRTGGLPASTHPLPEGGCEAEFSLSIPKPRLWSLEDPFLYVLDAVLQSDGDSEDRVSTYFGMREIGVGKLPGTEYPYVTLNGQPIYLQMALDQAYHPGGFYTFPSDEFVREEILRSRRIGLNGIRIHVKIDPPRKLYWADRLGLLVMADVPNSWGQPDAEMRREIETALRGMIRRDYNHPSVFSWVIFNETWGLRTKGKGYLPATQRWVSSMYRLARSLDPTRLVEDNSPNRRDHVVTDINSWHTYLPGYGWKERLDQISRDTYPGSKWNFIGERTQGEQPLFNSECGNVWGYEGSTGDVDWSWDYHIMMNEFRRHPKICGWLYTEHHDVINEWNGYYRFDRTAKITGLSGLVDGMSLEDLHRPFYIAPGGPLCREVRPGASVDVPLWASFLTGESPGAENLLLRAELYGWDSLGRKETYSRSARAVPFKPWMSEEIPPMEVTLPPKGSVAVLGLFLEDGLGTVLHRNFTTFLVSDGSSPRDELLELDGRKVRCLRFSPDAFRDAEWSLRHWQVLGGAKVNGAGAGHFEYRVPWPDDLEVGSVASASFRVEVSSKELFGKDRKGAGQLAGDFMRGKGTHDPSLNRNAYPMTDTARLRSAVRIRAGGGEVLRTAGRYELKDDPADHRGILSWHAQKRDRRLREAGSYGFLVTAQLSKDVLRAASAAGALTIRLEVDGALPGGLAIYGERFGRYPLDPTILLVLK